MFHGHISIYVNDRKHLFGVLLRSLTHKWGSRDSLWRWRRVRGSGLKEGHVGGKQQLAATVLAEEN